MPIRVQVKDGPLVEFPDGTPEETMQRALQQFRTETTWGEFAQGASLDLASGIMGFGKAIPDALSFVLPDAWTDPWSEFFERGQESARALQNEAYKREKSIKPITVNPETGEYQFQMPSAESVVGMGLESLPLAAFFGAAGPISAAARGATMLTQSGARVAPLAKAGRELDALVFGLINSGVVAPGQWRDTYHEAIEKKGMTPEQAREAANQAALATAGVSLGTGAAGGLVASKLGGGSANVLTAAGKGFVGEAPFEGVEEGLQNLIGDVSLGNDPDFLEAANASITAAAGGGAPGAVGAVAEYAGESGYQRSGAAREDLDLRREYFDALEEARRTAEEIEGGQEPPAAANPPPPPPAPVAPQQDTYDAALEELEKAAAGEPDTYFGFGGTETGDDFANLSDEELQAEIDTVQNAYNAGYQSEFVKTRLQALKDQAAKRWGEAGQARQEATTKVEIPQGQTALNQPQQSVGEWKPTPELEPIEKMGAAERALESAEDPNVPLPPDPAVPEAPKGPPDLLTELAGLRIRIDRDAFRGDLMNDVNPRIGNKWLFEGKRSGFKGMGPEELVTFLVENNYINQPDPNRPAQFGINEAVDLLNRALRGERVISQNYAAEEAQYQEDLRYIEEIGRQAFEEENAAWEENEAIWALRLAEAELESEQDIDAWVDKTFEEQSNATEQKTTESDSESSAESQGSLIPEATPAEQVRAEQERRDAERNGLNRDEVTPDQGEGELLAGNEVGSRPEQASIEDQINANQTETSESNEEREQADAENEASDEYIEEAFKDIQFTDKELALLEQIYPFDINDISPEGEMRRVDIIASISGTEEEIDSIVDQLRSGRNKRARRGEDGKLVHKNVRIREMLQEELGQGEDIGLSDETRQRLNEEATEDKKKIWPVEDGDKPANFTAGKESTQYISEEEAQAIQDEWVSYVNNVAATEDHSNDYVLSLYDYTGNWALPWAQAGYQVQTFDIQTGFDLVRDFQALEDHIAQLRAEGKNIVAVLAAPPCETFTTTSRQHWPTMHDNVNLPEVFRRYGVWASKHFQSPLEYAETMVMVVEQAIAAAEPRIWAMENPAVGRLQERLVLPDPRVIFNPNNFGDPYTKKTALWGNMNQDMPTANVEATKGTLIWKLSGSDRKARQVTPLGFAYSFFVANHKMMKEQDAAASSEGGGRIISQDRYDAAKAELRSAALRLNSGIDPAIIKNLAIMAAYHIENFGHDFKQWSSEVQKRFGNRFDDMLEAAWGQATQTREGLPTQKEAPPAPVEAQPTPAEPAPVSRAPEDFDPNSETGTAHVITNQERRLRGKSEILAQAREANADVLDRAQTAMDENPNLAPSLVSELLNDPDPSISKFKEAVLLIYKVDLQNRIKDIGKRAAATGSPQQAAQYHEQYRQVQLEMDMLDRATYESGSIWGDFGQFRGRLWANDYSFESRKALAEAKLGRPLSDSESKKLKAMAAKVEELQARLEGRNEAHADKVDKYWSEGHYQRLRAMYDRQGRPKAKPAGAVSLQQRKKAALQRFKEQSRKC
jgi:hypothetical protein